MPMQAPTWVSGPWFFRDERMYLIPGDSPMGYRLPLDSLPWVREDDYPYQHAHDPFAPPAPLRAAAQLRMQYERRCRPMRASERLVVSTVATARQSRTLQLHGEQRRRLCSRSRATTPPARGESRQDRSHGDLRRGARSGTRGRSEAEADAFGSGTALLHVFMPPLTRAGRLSRPARRGRSDGGRAADAGGARRLSAAARSRA